MKSIVNTTLFLSGAAVIFSGCTSNTIFKGGGKYAKIYMPQAQEYPAERSLIMSDSLQTIVYGADYGGPDNLGNNVEVHFSVDTSLVDSFNIANGTNYKVMPEGSYELSQQSATIPSGKVSTTPLNMNITTIGAIQAVTEYLLPVSVEVGDNIQVNKDLQTTYFLITGHYVEFDRKGWKILDVDSEQKDPPLPATNILDGDPTTFWHTEYSPDRPPLPHHVSIDMGEAHKMHGLRIIGRQDFTRGDPKTIIISVSSDGENWGNGETFTTTFDTENENTFYLSSPKEGRYFKLTVIDSYGFDNPPIAHIAEIYAF